MKGLAAILVELKAPLALEEVEIPSLALGQVLVKVHCSGLCGSQMGEIAGIKGSDPFIPHLLGHEGAGEVLEVGQGIKRVKVGDRVVLHWRKAGGLESIPATYQSKRGKINAGWVTTFNEYAVVSENRLTPIPSDFDVRAGALMGCAVTTGFGVVNNNARLKIGESVAILGAGGVGLSIVQGAALAGAYPIIAVDLIAPRLDLAQKLGATHVIHSKNVDAESEIRRIAGIKGVDVAIDNTGNVKVIELAYRVASSRGRCVLVGVPPSKDDVTLHTLPLHFEKSIKGSHGGEATPDVDIPNYVKMVQSGKLDLSPLIGAEYSLADINQALEDQRQGRSAGRILIRTSNR